jgi:hypothetical protein
MPTTVKNANSRAHKPPVPETTKIARKTQSPAKATKKAVKRTG